MGGSLRMNESLSAANWVKSRVDAWTEAPDNDELNEVLRRLGRWRSRLLANTYVAHHGPVVMQGLFAGMTYLTAASEGALVPRLLGTYESELHPHIRQIAEAGLDCVVNVGCAEGYYAVGLARLVEGVEVYAFDTDPGAQKACADLAAKNGVEARVTVGGEFKPEDFERFAGRRTLVMMDVEGAEPDLLDLQRAPALGAMSVIVETHDVYRQAARGQLMVRFASSHDIAVVEQQPKTLAYPPWLKDLPHLDQLLAVWEWRVRPTPWLVMRPRSDS
jgi:class 3 adenylate cyclase